MKRKNLTGEKKEYEALLQSVTDYVIAVNKNYQIIMANDLFINKLGARSEGFCYKAWKNRDDKCDDCLVEKSFQDGQVHLNEEEVVMKDGRVAQMLVKSTPVKDDNGKIVQSRIDASITKPLCFFMPTPKLERPQAGESPCLKVSL